MRAANCIGLLVVMVASAALADRPPASSEYRHLLHLKDAPEGTPCTVLEETDAYVLVKIPRSEVLRIARGAPEKLAPGALPTETPPEKRPEGLSGSAAGRMLWRGLPLPGTRVKILLLSTSGLFETTRLLDVEREAITDEKGIYRFEELAPGRYKLYWVPPEGAYWIRRLRTEPDFEVRPNEETEVGPLEIGVGTLN